MELGPVLTAIVIAGRVGASIAAELGTMKVTEQIDALEFDLRLRELDPFDELSFLGLECAMAGDAAIGPQLLARCADALDEGTRALDNGAQLREVAGPAQRGKQRERRLREAQRNPILTLNTFSSGNHSV